MGAMELDDLAILQCAERLCDSVWRDVSGWEPFAKDTVGKQLVRAVDSVGANIAEAFGRYHYGERFQFLYYARGSLYETKYWLNRAKQRRLLSSDTHYLDQITTLARMLNAFANSTKQQRRDVVKPAVMREALAIYDSADKPTRGPLFDATDLTYLASALQLPIANYSFPEYP